MAAADGLTPPGRGGGAEGKGVSRTGGGRVGDLERRVFPATMFGGASSRFAKHGKGPETTTLGRSCDMVLA